MPTLGEIATSVLLGDGESTVVTWNPSDVVETRETNFGEQYSFHCVDEIGSPVVVRGGARLISAWKEMLADAPKIKGGTSYEIRITARGEAGTTSRTWEVTLA